MNIAMLFVGVAHRNDAFLSLLLPQEAEDTYFLCSFTHVMLQKKTKRQPRKRLVAIRKSGARTPNATDAPKKPSLGKRIGFSIKRAKHFINSEMWHYESSDLKGFKRFGVGALKVIYVTAKGYTDDRIGRKATSLAYSTVLAIIPLLAVIVGIAKGFGVQDMISSFLYEYLPTHREELNQAFGYVENYLTHVKSGYFVGIGLILLFYTVFSLLSTIENTFNEIWDTRHNRSMRSRIANYMGMLLLLPIFITASSGLTIFMSTINNTFLSEYAIIGPVAEQLFNILPYVLIILVFTGLFMALPNTHVRFVPALISGTIAGVAFQIFQLLYINGVLWITKYNAIYGSVAAFLLLLLWMQLTWLITLMAAKMCFAIQNVDNFYYQKEAERISRRFHDFLSLIIAAHVMKRFVHPDGTEPYSVGTMARLCNIPPLLTGRIVSELLEVGVLTEVINRHKRTNVRRYLPAMDPNQLTVGLLLTKIDQRGSENFKVDETERFAPEWQYVLRSRDGFSNVTSQTLVKDLPLGTEQKEL